MANVKNITDLLRQVTIFPIVKSYPLARSPTQTLLFHETPLIIPSNRPSPSLAVSFIHTNWQLVAILGTGLQETNIEESERSHSRKKDDCREVPTTSKNCLKICHHFIYFLKIFIYLASLGLSRGAWTLECMGSIAVEQA